MTQVYNRVTDERGFPAQNILVDIELLSAAHAVLTEAFFFGDGPHNEDMINPNLSVRTDAEGSWQVDLYANEFITPVNTVYRFTHHLPAGDDVVITGVPFDSATTHIHFLSDLVN